MAGDNGNCDDDDLEEEEEEEENNMATSVLTINKEIWQFNRKYECF